MQHNAVNAMSLFPRAVNTSKAGVAKRSSSNDDSFMNLLSERITARNDSSLKSRPMETNNNLRKSDVIKDDLNPVNQAERKSEPQKLGYENENTVKVSKPEDKEKPEAEGINNKEGNKEKIKKEISSLEALIALLEELMVRLDIKYVSSDPVASKTLPQLVLEPETEKISPMELLMALIKGDAEKLKTIINELGESLQTPEINDLMEKIQGLIEKLTGDQDLTNSSELQAGTAGENASLEDLMNQLKAQCGQLIGKLNERVSKLNADLTLEQDVKTQIDSLLNAEIRSEEKTQEEPLKAETKTQSEAQDAKGDSSADVKNSPNPDVELASENENPFDNLIVQNQQIPGENSNQPSGLEKMQLPLSGKPLAHTVTNQVIMKVKLMAGENRQEMEMHLKPDSLGKLSLKIIHERGEILAKITAENQQVKGILESNMQMLKDALEKSGLTVQSLSVSVGNGNENGRNKENGGEKDRELSTGLARAANSSSSADADSLKLRARIEKEYFEETSQINLTA